MLSFSVPVMVAWLRSSTGIVNGVDLEQLYRSAWFVDTISEISTSVFFHGDVMMVRWLWIFVYWVFKLKF